MEVHHDFAAPRYGFRIFGDRENAMLDLWSFQHFASGILVASLMMHVGFLSKMQLTEFCAVLFLLALAWEMLELSMECGCFGKAVSLWKKGNECWANRFLGDVPLVVFGGMLGRRFDGAWKVVLVPAAVWLILNVLAPDSMRIQDSLFRFWARLKARLL